MNEPAPRGIIQFPDQNERDLRAGVKKPLKQIGHVAVAHPDDDLSLKNVRDILGKTAVHIANLPVEENLLARTETASGSKVIPFVNERKNKLEKVA